MKKLIKSYCWFLFTFNGWPFSHVPKFGWALLESLWTAFLCMIKFVMLPFHPLLVAICMCGKDYRDRVLSGYERKAVKPAVIEGTVKITLG